MEHCAITCEDQLITTVMNSTVKSFIDLQIENGNFTHIFRKNAIEQCADKNCSGIDSGVVEGMSYHEIARWKSTSQVSNPPTSSPTGKMNDTPTRVDSSKPTSYKSTRQNSSSRKSKGSKSTTLTKGKSPTTTSKSKSKGSKQPK